MNRETAVALNYALSRGFVIHPDVLSSLASMDGVQIHRIIRQLVKEKSQRGQYHIGSKDLTAIMGSGAEVNIECEYEVLFDPTGKTTSAEGLDGYERLFSSRQAKLKKIASERPECKRVVSISNLAGVKTDPKDDVYVCGLVYERSFDRNVARLSVEDATGLQEFLVWDEQQQGVVQGLLLDQFVIVRAGVSRAGGFVAREIIQPGVADRKTNRSETDAHAALVSDLHVGSRYFLEEEFREFARWLGSDDPIAKKIKFVLVAGDLVDGVGIYPNQDRELVCLTLESQLAKLVEILSIIPKDIEVFMITGNHDPGRRALPQPAIPERYNGALWKNKNWHLLGNPSLVALNGVKVLMFHGQSIDDIVKTTPGFSYDNPIEVMKSLVRARHVGPTYGSQTPIAPETEDMLVMDDVPDILHVGHVHVVGVDMYKNVLLVNSGAWQGQTPFQNSVGVTPTPGVAVIVNLKTFKAYTKSFV